MREEISSAEQVVSATKHDYWHFESRTLSWMAFLQSLCFVSVVAQLQKVCTNSLIIYNN